MSTSMELPRIPTIIRWKDLEPSWHLPNQVAGYFRWMISWVAGPEGYYNSNPDKAVLSYNTSIGFQNLAAGNRQRGLHYHGVTEIYIILRGQVLGWDGYGESHIAGPLDCIYIPAGVPHGVRSYGDDPVDLIWIHDGIEKKGTTVYWDESMPNPQDESKEKISIIRYNNLDPNWDTAGKQTPGEIHSMINWVGGVVGSVNANPGLAMYNDKVAVGLLKIPEAHKQIISGRSNAEFCVLIRGKAVVKLSDDTEELGKLDAIYIPAGCSRTIRNHGHEPAYIVMVHERQSEN